MESFHPLLKHCIIVGMLYVLILGNYVISVP